MANRIFDLPETKGTFQVKGRINGTKKTNNFYTTKKTKNDKDFRMVNFGCEYDTHKTVYLNMNGMPQDKVYFSKRNPDTNKVETKAVNWAQRKTFNEDGFRIIGVQLGLTKTTDKDGNEVNDKKNMHSFDACEYIKSNLKDDMSTFIRGNIEYSSYFDNENNLRRGIKYTPTQISLCKEVNFDEYDETNKMIHDFTQPIVFTGIEKETNDGKDTGRFILSAKIVTYNDIIDVEYIVTNAKLATQFKKGLKPYNAMTVYGKIEVTHTIQEVTEDDVWGEANRMDSSVSGSSKTEMIITGANPKTIDRETYTEKEVSAAIKAIRNAKTAERNFSGATKKNINIDPADDDWGSDGFDDDSTPW